MQSGVNRARYQNTKFLQRLELALLDSESRPLAHLYLKEGAVPKYDHKPLGGLLQYDRPTPALAAARIQRWSLLLGGYEDRIKTRSVTVQNWDTCEFSSGDNVLVHNYGEREKWTAGTVKSTSGARMITVQTPSQVVRRHADQVRLRHPSNAQDAASAWTRRTYYLFSLKNSQLGVMMEISSAALSLN
ncbi:uncharacterized protein LOC135395898 [Ornithodoros turicata]|uniref:uncharacterized protein LOC135395898 n=1 Tax=Ornithodoros turicata TaxID=34597 RepID=UPI003139D1F7